MGGRRPGARPSFRRCSRQDPPVPDTPTIWKRRVVLMAVVGLIVAIPVTIVARGGGDDEGEAAPPAVATPEVGDIEFDRKLGIELRLPQGWRRKDEKGGVVSFRSRDGSVLIAVSAPGPAKDYEEIASAGIDSIEGEYRKAEVTDRMTRLKLGGLRAKTVAITAANPKTGEPIQILVSAAKGEKRAYLVEVFAGGAHPTQSLVEAQTLLNNLTLTG
jgi:hypothetical protein